jgi:hypothetical protein
VKKGRCQRRPPGGWTSLAPSFGRNKLGKFKHKKALLNPVCYTIYPGLTRLDFIKYNTPKYGEEVKGKEARLTPIT